MNDETRTNKSHQSHDKPAYKYTTADLDSEQMYYALLRHDAKTVKDLMYKVWKYNNGKMKPFHLAPEANKETYPLYMAMQDKDANEKIVKIILQYGFNNGVPVRDVEEMINRAIANDDPEVLPIIWLKKDKQRRCRAYRQRILKKCIAYQKPNCIRYFAARPTWIMYTNKIDIIQDRNSELILELARGVRPRIAKPMLELLQAIDKENQLLISIN